MDKNQVGQRIREARMARGWTQEQLGHAYGCSQANISDMERGIISIDLGDLHNLALTLGQSLDYFFPPSESKQQDRFSIDLALDALPPGTTRDEVFACVLAMVVDANRRVLEKKNSGK